jgi:uracil-DNA glycosylase
MKTDLPCSWKDVLAKEFEQPYFHKLEQFVDSERRQHAVYPREHEVFQAFQWTPFEEVKVVLLGQDPYHGDGQAHGLCFSVRPGVKPPPSLVNIFKELQTDLGCRIPKHGCLESWARQGILLLNAVLTVRAHQANSHRNRGWEQFTDAAIRAVNNRPEPAVFVFWGNNAQKKSKLVDADKHRVIQGAHPSPLSAAKFFGSRPFSRINRAQEELEKDLIDWQLPDQ